MLGKGLESLIPKKSVSDEQSTVQNEPAVFQPQQPAKQENFSTPEQPGSIQSINQKDAEENSPSPRPTPMPENNFIKARSSTKDAIFHIEVEKINSNPLQPRKNFDQEALKELAASIREFGILQPIVVSKTEEDNEYGTKVEYQLIAGERRLMAAKLLGWERVPAIVRRVESNANNLELAIIENLQRQNLNAVETARAYAKLQDEFGLTQREVATRMGKSRETIANAMRLLDLPSEIQDAIAKGQINESQARLLLTISDPAQQQKLFKELTEKNLSVRELKQKIGGVTQNTKYNIQNTATDPEILSLQEKLTELLGAKVRIEKGQKEGKIIISFYSPEEIQGIVEKLNPKE